MLDIREGDEFIVDLRANLPGRPLLSGRPHPRRRIRQPGRTHRAVRFVGRTATCAATTRPTAAACARPSCARRSSSRASARASTRAACIRSAAASARTRASTTRRRPARRCGPPATAASHSRGLKGGYGNAMISNTAVVSLPCMGTCRASPAGRSGRAVRQGEVIGYVGMTGASTGPHLHYEYRINGQHKNPSTIPLPNTEIPTPYGRVPPQAGAALAQLEITERGRRGERSPAAERPRRGPTRPSADAQAETGGLQVVGLLLEVGGCQRMLGEPAFWKSQPPASVPAPSARSRQGSAGRGPGAAAPRAAAARSGTPP